MYCSCKLNGVILRFLFTDAKLPKPIISHRLTSALTTQGTPLACDSRMPEARYFVGFPRYHRRGGNR